MSHQLVCDCASADSRSVQQLKLIYRSDIGNIVVQPNDERDVLKDRRSDSDRFARQGSETNCAAS
jgi:hypothetical protein